MDKVAIVGAGPGGLAAARWLRSEGFEPRLFEQARAIGGQWSGDERFCGVWPTLHTNTSRALTQFSDLPHLPGLPLYPSNRELHDYLGRYADHFDLRARTRLGTTVHRIERAARGWTLRHDGGDETFERVIVASGRFHHPKLPSVSGIDGFTGSLGVAHTYGYKQPQRYRGKRVLVAGCAISALEIASDLAMLGAARVVVCQRRQRYVLPKQAAGATTDGLLFTRELAHAQATLPPEQWAATIKDLVLRVAGSPEQYGAPKPADSIAEAGLTLCQHYLPMVAEGRIDVRPWMAAIEGEQVSFADGRAESFDAIIFGTGFELRLPFLDDEILRSLDLDGQHIDLVRRSFHPDLPGLAFVGLWDQSGPNLPPLELQARWIAYVWSGAIAAPSADEMAQSLADVRARRHLPAKTAMHLVALDFARAAGVEPDPAQWPRLANALRHGPLLPVSFRLQGRDALPDAAQRFEADLPASFS